MELNYLSSALTSRICWFVVLLAGVSSFVIRYEEVKMLLEGLK